MQLLKPAPLSIATATAASLIALKSHGAQAALPAIIATMTPEQFTSLITSWGTVILAGLGTLGVIISAIGAAVWKARADWQQKAREYEARFEEGTRHSCENREAIAQVNAVAPTPVATIAAPATPPVTASQPLNP